MHLKVEIQIPVHWNLIGPSMTTPPSVLSPSIILRLPNSHRAVTSQTINTLYVSKILSNLFFYLVKEIL